MAHVHPLLTHELFEELRLGFLYCYQVDKCPDRVGTQLLAGFQPYLETEAEAAACILGISAASLEVGQSTNYWTNLADILIANVLHRPSWFGLQSPTDVEKRDLMRTFQKEYSV